MAKKEQDLQQVVEDALAEQKVPHVKFKGIDPRNIDVDRLTKPSKETRQERWGKGLTFLAIILIGVLIVAIIGFVGMHEGG